MRSVEPESTSLPTGARSLAAVRFLRCSRQHEKGYNKSV
jgi:hypothetical protein